MRVATTVRAQAIASSTDWPNGSIRLGWQTTSAAAIHARHFVVRHSPDDPHSLAALELRAQRAVADEREASFAEPCERVGEANDVLALAERADTQERRRLNVMFGRVVRREALEIDARVDDVCLSARFGQLRLELATQVVRDGDDRRRAFDDAARERRNSRDRADVANVPSVRGDDERRVDARRDQP